MLVSRFPPDAAFHPSACRQPPQIPAVARVNPAEGGMTDPIRLGEAQTNQLFLELRLHGRGQIDAPVINTLPENIQPRLRRRNGAG